MLENVFESFLLKGIEYNFENVTTISGKYSNKEYICEIDLEKRKYMYRCENVTVHKTIGFIEKSNTLIIDYEIKNENEDRIKFDVIPLVTYRDLMHMKKASYLKFGSRTVEGGVLINLSITDSKNLYLMCKDSKYITLEGYLNNVKHESTGLELKKDVYVEDLYLPGKFEISISGNETKRIRLYVSDEIIKMDEQLEKYTLVVEEDDEYPELKKLKKSLAFFENTSLLSLPGFLKEDEILNNLDIKNYENILSGLLDIIRGIDGRYICLKKYDSAVTNIKKYIALLNNMPEYVKKSSIYFKCKFWLVEVINKLYLISEESIDKFIKDYICYCLADIEAILMGGIYDLVKNLEIVSLIYNVIKVYEDILKDVRYKELEEDILETCEKKFWVEELRLLKQNADEFETHCKADMLYGISLSYSPFSNIVKMKVMDTIFRELYTPFGIRDVKKRRREVGALVYPKYMAHFINANLNQNGNTYASKKIAYNLVKDLFLDIDKYVENNVKYVYNEKGIDIDYKVLDYYTTCEMIRLYSMFM